MDKIKCVVMEFEGLTQTIRWACPEPRSTAADLCPQTAEVLNSYVEKMLAISKNCRWYPVT